MSLIALVAAGAVAQELPRQWHFSSDGRRIIAGGVPSDGFYDESEIPVLELTFEQSDYWSQLTANYESKTEIPATLTIDGVELPEVGVRFRGNTSYRNVRGDKKSFNIALDYTDDDQDYDDYNTLNLNNAYEDPSFLREVLYLNLSRNHLPSARANYVHLYINGEDWGLYPNVQQLDGRYLKEWFLSNDGTRWRAERSVSTGGPGGGPGGGGAGAFGTGVSSLNYLGDDTSEYTPNYTLKKANKDDPWSDLVTTCSVLNNTPLEELEDELNKVMDVDRALWFLAHEIIFADDDSYVNKGGMDYYLYWEVETGRMTPLEYDGNSCMGARRATWSPFLNEQDTRYPLMNRLFAVPALRQRYLAHFRTIIEESLDPEMIDAKIDAYYAMIDGYVESDPKKIYTYQEFLSEKDVLKNFFQNRRAYLLANSEVASAAPVITDVEFGGGELGFEAPEPNESVLVTASVGGEVPVAGANLYYATGLVGSFERISMYDDGEHGDGASGDGLFGGEVPGFNAGTYVRFYVEAVADDDAGTVSYMPAGAEHDVFFYKVQTAGMVESDVVINELMADNDNTALDPAGDYDDWIELYNNSADPIDIGGWYLSDDEGDPTQWVIPEGTVITGHGYLIVWADEDDDQEGLHANFKLSASGETLLLVTADGGIADQVTFGEQETDVSYARIPNGTGDFMSTGATFGVSNDPVSSVWSSAVETAGLTISPNPTSEMVMISASYSDPVDVSLFDPVGRVLVRTTLRGSTSIDVSGLEPGVYFIQAGDTVTKLIVQ